MNKETGIYSYNENDGDVEMTKFSVAGCGLKTRKRADANEPRPKLYVKCNGEYKHLPLPYGTWSVTTMVFKMK